MKRFFIRVAVFILRLANLGQVNIVPCFDTPPAPIGLQPIQLSLPCGVTLNYLYLLRGQKLLLG